MRSEKNTFATPLGERGDKTRSMSACNAAQRPRSLNECIDICQRNRCSVRCPTIGASRSRAEGRLSRRPPPPPPLWVPETGQRKRIAPLSSHPPLVLSPSSALLSQQASNVVFAYVSVARCSVSRAVLARASGAETAMRRFQFPPDACVRAHACLNQSMQSVSRSVAVRRVRRVRRVVSSGANAMPCHVICDLGPTDGRTDGENESPRPGRSSKISHHQAPAHAVRCALSSFLLDLGPHPSSSLNVDHMLTAHALTHSHSPAY